MDHERMDRLLAAINTFNRSSDITDFGALLADACVYENHGSSGDQIRHALHGQASTRWSGHHPISIATSGDLIVTIARNSFRDDTTSLIGNVYKFGADGLIERIVSLDAHDRER